MKKNAFEIAFALGALAVIWVGLNVARSHLLVLLMTTVIGGVYLFATLELRQHRRTTAQLAQALAQVPTQLQALEDWLVQVPTTLHSAVRQRIEGERSTPLPGPALTPYLVGLLVMLGMLGTFLGMVVTLNGAVFALEGSHSVQDMRAAFSEPMRGLGLAFGTSVAGVATSAMLGLMSSLTRREQSLAAQRLDQLIGSQLRHFSLAHQRQDTLRALQQQSLALPQVAQQLQALMNQMAQQQQHLADRLLHNQQGFHSEIRSVYHDLAQSVDSSMRNSLGQSMQMASDSLRPVVQSTLADMAQQTGQLHERLHESFGQRTEALLKRLQQGWAEQQAQQAGADQQRLDAWRLALQASTEALQSQWQRTGEQTMAHIGRLIETAGEAPRAAAQVIGQLRQEISAGLARDNSLLEERSRILGTLNTLLDAITQASLEQRGVIDQLVSSGQQTLAQASQHFQQQLAAETGKLDALAAQVSASALDVASLGEAFGSAARSFGASHEQLLASLRQIEAAIDKSMTRSDEQLAYYVAQAREIVELSIGGQKDVLEALQQRQTQGAA